MMLLLGIATGLVPYLCVRVNRRFRPYRDARGPIEKLWHRTPFPAWRWKWSRYRSRLRERWDAWVLARFVSRPWFRKLFRLDARRYRVSFVEVCFYGNDRETGGAPPRVLAVSRHRTRLGAEWHRRHFRYGTLGSFRLVTIVEKDPTLAPDPSNVSWWGCFFEDAA